MTNEVLANVMTWGNVRSHGAAGVLIDLSVATGFLLAGALVVNHLFARRIGAGLRQWLFLAVFARVFVPLALPAGWHSPLGLLGRGSTLAAAGAVAFEAPVVQASAAMGAAAGPTPWLLGLYTVGACVLLGLWALARVRLDRQLASARLAGGNWHTLCGIPVLEHATLGPLVAGILRPRIVVPAALLASSPAEDLSLLLAHETAHVRRRDHLLIPLVQLLTIAAWPVLPLWFAARQVRGLVELACDERVLAGRRGEQRRRYGELLLELSGASLLASPHAPSFGWALRTRVRALKRARRWRQGVQTSLVAGLGALLLACSGAPAPDEAAPEGAKPDANDQAKAGGPRASMLAPQPILTITASGAFFLGRTAIEPAALEAQLRQALTAAGTTTLLVRGNQAAMAASAVDVMAIAKRAGATTINILADAPADELPRCPPDQLCGRKGPLPPAAPEPPAASARGSLDRTVIQTVIRATLGDIKNCYEAGLARSPKLRGRVVARFTIGDAGKVVASAIKKSTLRDERVERCIGDVVGKMEFPRPLGGGIVMVEYPFTFTPSD
jgi:beta-lactamase regulating signal transducer with metallopeptidase domain/biopolymer transport protein ExbD